METGEAPAKTTPPEDLELNQEVSRLNAVLYETHTLRLSTSDADGSRWLTDMYVMLDVTDSYALSRDGEPIPDGRYKLVARKDREGRKGLVPIDGENEFDADAWAQLMAKTDWTPATPSQWSVAEHPGKAMLFSAVIEPEGELAYDQAALMGEETWSTLHRHYEDVSAQYALGREKVLFRILSGNLVVAYVAGIQIPDGQEGIAQAIAELSQVDNSTSNNDEQEAA